ncbi:ATP-binding protein [uncultured Microbulbifer sp.]|uniref:ATP-binding protein n=1 Tax=uncultured Microbulbifer sp. TaxID=348147 RepID=UPI0025E33700|nr:ATP-binding protein [uncultured Microbulbifer sp.]
MLAETEAYYPLAQRISSDTGLSQNVVLDLVEDQYGRVWVGTQDGLNLLNNNEYLVFRSDQRERYISGTVIFDLEVGGENSLWVASDAGIDHINTTTLKTRHLTLPQASRMVSRLLQTDDRNLYYLSDGMLYRYDLKREQAQQVPLPTGYGRLDFFRPVSPDHLLLKGDKLGVLNLRNDRVQPFVPDIPQGEVKSAVAAGKHIWFSLRDQGVFRCQLDGSACAEFSLHRGNFPSNNIAQLKKQGSTLYFATDRGIGRLNIDHDTLRWIYPHSKNRAYQASHIARNLLVSRFGDIFVGTFNGLYRIPAEYTKIQALNTDSDTFPDSLIDLTTVELGGKEWLAIAEAEQVSLWQLVSGRLRAGPHFYYPPGFEATHILTDGKSLYLSSLTSGSYLLEPDSGRYTPLQQRFSGLSNDEISNLDSPQADIRIFHSDRGMQVFRQRDGRWQLHWQQAFPAGSAAARFRDGRLYVASYHNGLRSASIEKDWRKPATWLQHRGLGIAINLFSTDEQLYVLTANRGLFQIETAAASSQPRITRVPVSDSLSSQTLVCALQDDRGRLLIATHKGLNILDRQRRIQAILTGQQGVHEQEFAQFRCGKMDGIPFFGGDAGLTLLHDTSIRSTQPGKATWSYLETEETTQRINADQPLRLTSPGLLRLHFIAVPSQLPQQAVYRYRILPLSDSWSELKSSFVTLTNLRPGNYQVELQVWNYAAQSAPLSRISLDIKPTFWESPLAIAGYILAALSVIALIVANKLRADRARLELAVERSQRQENYARQLEKEVQARTEELEQKKEEAQNANRAKTRFIAAASHDLKHPINLIKFQVQQEPANPLRHRIESSLSFLEKLVDSVVELARLDARVIKPNIAPLDLNAFLQQLRDELGDFAQHQGVTLELRAAADLWVASDELLLRRVLGNVLDNAIKISAPNTSVTISAIREGPRVVVSVSDQGPGITDAMRETLFTPFKRWTQRYQGSGLGLSVVKGMSDLLGMDLQVHSKPGLGSRFTFTLPVAEPVQTVSRDRRAVSLALVEDDPEQRKQLETQLSARLTEVTSFATAEALIASAGHFDVILSDVDLGQAQDGFAYIEAYRQRLKGAKVLVYMSGNPEARARMPEQRDVFFLPKPLKIGKLMWILHQANRSQL